MWRINRFLLCLPSGLTSFLVYNVFQSWSYLTRWRSFIWRRREITKPRWTTTFDPTIFNAAYQDALVKVPFPRQLLSLFLSLLSFASFPVSAYSFSTFLHYLCLPPSLCASLTLALRPHCSSWASLLVWSNLRLFGRIFMVKDSSSSHPRSNCGTGSASECASTLFAAGSNPLGDRQVCESLPTTINAGDLIIDVSSVLLLYFYIYSL